MKKTIFGTLLIMLFLCSCVTIKDRNLVRNQVTPGKVMEKPLPKNIPIPNPPQEDIIDQRIIPRILSEQENNMKNSFKDRMLNRKYNIDLQGGDIKDILIALVKNTEIGLVIEPGVLGTVPVVDLKDVSLSQILKYLLPPLNVNYRFEGRNLRVFPAPLKLKYFSLNYLSASRNGQRQVSFSTRSGSGGSSSTGSGSGGSGGGGSGGGGSGSGSGQNQSSSTITVDYKNNVWSTFVESLKVLVFNKNGGLIDIGEKGSQSSSGGAASFAFGDKNGKMLIISPQSGIIVVNALEQDLNRVADFIEKYEGSVQRQIWIEARIIEVTLSKAYQMGIDWGVAFNGINFIGNIPGKRSLMTQMHTFTPGDVSDQSLTTASSGVYQFAASNGAIDFLIDAISKQGNLKVLASPRISTLNNEKAVIRVVREEAFFNLQTQVSQGLGGNVAAPTINVTTIPIGIVMDIIPQADEDGNVVLSINPDISELLEVRKFEVQGAMATQPVIDRRSIDTIAKLKHNETLIIAGIMKERKQEVLKGVPILYRLPLIGNLFRRTEQKIEKTELIIMITPRLISGKTHLELTASEKERVLNAIQPMKFGDVASIKEALEGELSILKKKKEGK
jgi:MSHA type pilus biogenesis protein MshL